MHKFERWYDKDEDLAIFLAFLESLDERQKEILAKEILLIIFTTLDLDVDTEISSLKSLTYEQNKRWYDRSVNVQSVVELLKNLSFSQRDEVMVKIAELIQQLLLMGE